MFGLFEINDENKQIIIESGKYDTISLIKSLNNNNINLLFELDEITQKVKVSGESNFSILTSILSFDILGFTSSCSNNNSYKSDKCIDLRRDDKVYLYFIKSVSLKVYFLLSQFNNVTLLQLNIHKP